MHKSVNKELPLSKLELSNKSMVVYLKMSVKIMPEYKAASPIRWGSIFWILIYESKK